MSRISLSALLVLAAGSASFGQAFTITPNGNGASTTNGRFAVTAPASNPASTTLGNVTFNATTTASVDQAFSYQWFWHVNNSAGSSQDTREWLMSNGTSSGTSSFATLTSGNNLGTLNNATVSFDNRNVTLGYRFDAVSNYVITNDGTGPRVLNTMTITNRDTGVLNLSLFNYVDPTAAGTDAGDTVAYDPSLGAFNYSDGASTIQHRALGATAYQSTEWSLGASTTALNRTMIDTARHNLNNTIVAGAGDRLSAFQFDMILNPGESRVIYVGVALGTTAPIPAPAAAAVAGLVGVAGLRRRRIA